MPFLLSKVAAWFPDFQRGMGTVATDGTEGRHDSAFVYQLGWAGEALVQLLL